MGLLLNISGCNSQVTRCQTSQNCPADEVCLQGICEKRVCASSQDCNIEEFCDPPTGQCMSGCLEESDCYYGSTCLDGQCESKKCRSTSLDCRAGQYCDVSTGTCFDAAGPYCTPCNPGDDCGGGDNRCMWVGGTGPYCLPECSESRPCPAGYDCIPLTDAGELISYYCVTLCAYINEFDQVTPEPVLNKALLPDTP